MNFTSFNHFLKILESIKNLTAPTARESRGERRSGVQGFRPAVASMLHTRRGGDMHRKGDTEDRAASGDTRKCVPAWR
jgi:hypothetical protein